MSNVSETNIPQQSMNTVTGESFSQKVNNLSDQNFMRHISNVLLFLTKLVIVACIIAAIVYIVYYVYQQYFIQQSDIEVDYSDVDEDTEDKDNVDISDSHISEDEVDEVFNISSNTFTYPEAKGVCKAFNAKLATLTDVQNAHKKGANWCNYGWSEDQMALFPIQERFYDSLQRVSDDQRMICGRPGINGGYFADDQMRFGVNCYGVKPKQKDIDLLYWKLMKNKKDFYKNQEDEEEEEEEELTPEQRLERETQKKIEENKNSIIILPFNNDEWSKLDN